MSASTYKTPWWGAGLLAFLGLPGLSPSAQPVQPAPEATPFYFDFWNLSGQRSVLSDPWKVTGEPGDPEPSATPAPTASVGATSFMSLMQRLARADDVPGSDINAWSASGLRRDPGRIYAKIDSQLDALRAKATLDLPDLDDLRWSPAMGRNWKAQHELNLPLPEAESLFIFGSFDGNGTALANQQPTVVSRTGMGLKFSPLPKSELQLRGGPVLTYSDPNSAGRYLERSQVMVELLAKVPLFGPLQLQYKSSAIPALAQTDKDTLNHDLKIALPLGNSSEFYLGAKYRWEYTSNPSPWIDRASLYLGLELKR